MGLLALSLFAWLAACYLPLETSDEQLRRDFRVRSLIAGTAVGILGGLVLGLASLHAAHVFSRLTGTWPGRADLALAGAALAASLLASWRGRFSQARLLSATVVVLVIVGWGWAMAPWLIVDGLTVTEAAAPRTTLRLVAWILGGGALVLLPAYAYLVATFKGRVLFPRE